MHVGGLAAGGPGPLHGLGQGGHQVDDLAGLRLGLLQLRRLAVFSLRFDDLGEGLGVGGLELLTVEVFAGMVSMSVRALSISSSVSSTGGGSSSFGDLISSGQRMACSTITSTRTRSRPSLSLPDQAYFATATFRRPGERFPQQLVRLGSDQS
ncbi:hypothetical protein GCM10010244_37920 [Streptomyces coeruleorubidus]|nr:hypothetical protein [Streptomyces bellus]GGU08272.1 hypothetical protein GCM10010244_37920 [Streptomyces bellus]